MNFLTDYFLLLVKNGRRLLFFIAPLLLLINAGCTLIFLQYSPNIADRVYLHQLEYQEKKVQKKPQNILLLEKVCADLVKYGYGFLMERADRAILIDYKKGRELYKQALDHFSQAVKYGERALALKYPEYGSWIGNPSAYSPKFISGDVSLLYWIAAAYGGAISASRADAQWLVHLPRVGQLFDAALLINPEWNHGAIYSAMISYTMSQANPPVNSELIARDYFKKAVAASNGKDCSPFLTVAEKISKINQDKKEFVFLLNKVLLIDSPYNSDLRLANIISQRRAKWLLSNVDEYFY